MQFGSLLIVLFQVSLASLVLCTDWQRRHLKQKKKANALLIVRRRKKSENTSVFMRKYKAREFKE